METVLLGFEPDNPLPPRLGKLEGLFANLADHDVMLAFDTAAQTLQSAGAELRVAPLPQGFDDLLIPHRLIMAAEAAAFHELRFAEHPEEYEPCITELLNEGLAATGTDYIRARTQQVVMQRSIQESFTGLDALICPATTSPAPDRSTTGNPAFNSPWSFSGLPTISFPVGLSSDGLPLAIQIVGRPFGEAALFQTARWCERVIRDAIQ